MTIALPRLDRSTAAERGITLADFLVPIRVGERLGTRVRHIALVVAGTLFVSLCAQVYIPTLPVPFTGQTFGVLLVGGALGFRRGLVALLLYIAIGAIGIPVYAQGGSGVHVIQGATGGYLVGFVVAAALVGRLAELGWDRRIGGALAMMAIGTAVIYAIGVPWLKVAAGLSWTDAVAGGMTKFLIWDAAKLAVAAGIFPVAWWLVGRRPDDR
ncbi:MAG: biotin transport system substrate-specific component [Chloroflexota bacterium]|jgi:biotin transport system substrate-specific component|nr:biotin transport system substrate-specific component [Chloroflexota bacterium]